MDVFKTVRLFDSWLILPVGTVVSHVWGHILYRSAQQTRILPAIRIAHISSGIVLPILLSLLSCARLEHCKTGSERLRETHVPVFKVGS